MQLCGTVAFSPTSAVSISASTPASTLKASFIQHRKSMSSHDVKTHSSVSPAEGPTSTLFKSMDSEHADSRI